MSPLQILGLSATALFGYKVFDELQQSQGVGAQVKLLGPQSAQGAALGEIESAHRGNVLLFAALTAAALGTTAYVWNKG